jgi:hypothetical protein
MCLHTPARRGELHLMTFQPGDAASWAPSFSPVAAARFLEMVETELMARQLTFSGTAPFLTDVTGRQLFLGNIAQSCANAKPAEQRRILREFFDVVLAVSDHVDISPDVARMSLRLRLAPNETLGPTDEGSSFDTVLSRPALPGTKWLLFVRRPNSGQGVTSEALQAWGIDIDDAFTLAKKNSLRHEAGTVESHPDMFTMFGNSMFTATSILRVHRWEPQHDDAIFVSAPTRHYVLARQADNEGFDLLDGFVNLTAELFTDGPYSLSPHIWLVPPGGMGEYGELAQQISQ